MGTKYPPADVSGNLNQSALKWLVTLRMLASDTKKSSQDKFMCINRAK
jgi:hypothetical protein